MKLEECPRPDTVASDDCAPESPWSAHTELNRGEVLDRRFRLVEVLRDGGMATIFKAEDLQNGGEFVAVKVPHKHYEIDVATFKRFQCEEDIGTRLNHPYVLKFLRVEGKKSRPYIAMEYVRGETLFDQLYLFKIFPEPDVLAIAALICEGVQYLHEQGVIHRDLKPSNIMICEDESIRIVDLGIALAAESKKVGLWSGVGTPDYMAPERVNGRPGDARTDVYSLGVMLYEMLTGAVPFANDNADLMQEYRVTGDPVAPRKLNPRISPQAEEIVLHALARNPADRYPSAAALLADLNAPAKVTVTGRCDRLQPSTKWKRIWRKARWVALWALLPVIVQVVLFFLIWRHLGKK